MNRQQAVEAGVVKRRHDFGARLRAERVQSGFTLRELAALLDVSSTHLCDVENGRRPPFGLSKVKMAEHVLRAPSGYLQHEAEKDLIERVVERALAKWRDS